MSATAAFVALEGVRNDRALFAELHRSFAAVHVASTRERAVSELTALGEQVVAAIIGVRERIDTDVLAALPGLRVLGSVGVGTDHLDLVALEARDIRLVTTPGVNAVSVAEHAMTMILALAKRVLPSHAAVLGGRDRAGLAESPIELRGRRVGVLGAGATARALFPMLRAFGTEPTVWTRNPGKHADLPLADLESLFRRSDVVSIHLPLTPQTRGLVGAGLLRSLPPGALVVNTARKEILDLSALPAVVRERPDLRFAVDDFGLAADGTATALGDASVLSPHTAGVTVEALQAMQEQVVKEVVQAVDPAVVLSAEG